MREKIAYDENLILNKIKELVYFKGKSILEIGRNIYKKSVRECGVIEWVSLDHMKKDYILDDG